MTIAKNGISRRGFIGTISGAAALTLLQLDRKAIAGRSPGGRMITDYVGRLCYNENPLGPSPAALEAIQNEAEMAHRYPDWYAESLVSMLATHYDVSAGRVTCGVGATEILRLLAMALCEPGTNVVAPTPSYGQFTSDAQRFGSSVRLANLDSDHRVDLQAVRDRVDSNTVAVCITNPNNPTATILDPSELEAFVDDLPPGVTTIVDEAYYEFVSVEDYPSAIDMVRSDRNVVVVKTFSKVYGLAGARIGFAVGDSSVIGQMRSFMLYAMISRPSLEAAKAALDDTDHVDATVELASQTKEYCFGEFDRMGLEYIPSETNFFMVDCGRSGDWVRGQLATRGIYVRSGWGMQNHIRVSTGRMEEMEDFIAALEDILHQVGAGDELPKPTRTDLYQAYPNPFNSSTTIKIYLPKTSNSRLEVFDIRGRLVRTLCDRTLGAGEHSFTWNGTNFSGHSVSSGSYFYRLTVGDDVMTRRMILLK